MLRLVPLAYVRADLGSPRTRERSDAAAADPRSAGSPCRAGDCTYHARRRLDAQRASDRSDCGAVLFLVAAPAAADATLFLGANTTPESRKTQGFAVGAGLLLIGFEFEYASTSEDLRSLAPALKTYIGNVLLQTPFTIFGIQPYFTTGGGVYHEELGTPGRPASG